MKNSGIASQFNFHSLYSIQSKVGQTKFSIKFLFLKIIIKVK
jgi:hypothetical protein